MTNRITSKVTQLSKQKLVPAVIVDVLGVYCSVRLGGIGKQLNGLNYYGPVPERGQICQVNYQTGTPYVLTSIPATLTPEEEGIIYPADPPRMQKAQDNKVYTFVIAAYDLESGIVVAGWPGPKLSDPQIALLISAYCVDGTSVTFNIEERSTVGTPGTDLLDGDMVALTSEITATEFALAELTEERWLWLDISAVSGTPTKFVVTLKTMVIAI
jgi:hypothetical protein